MQDSDVKKTKPQSKKLRWLEIFGFLIVFAVVLKVISYAIDPIRTDRPDMVLPRDKSVTAALTEKKDTMDVLIVGDSEAMVVASPKMMMEEAGIEAYNCNQLGQRSLDAYLFVRKILDKQHPQVMILETNVIAQETLLKTEALMTNSALVNEIFPVIRYHSNWRYLSGLEKPEPYDVEKGFEAVEVVDPYNGDEYMFETEERGYINGIAMFNLEQIRKLCEEKGVTLVLVTSPSPVNMSYPVHNTLQDYADENNLDYIDFNVLKDEIGIDWSQDTGDAGDHINIYGCEKTTEYLIDYLNENYDLPDHR